MNRLICQNSEETVAVERVLHQLVDDWGIPWRNLDEIVLRWQSFVDEVHRGYELSLYDYTVELELRDSLDEARRALPGRLAKQLEQILSPFDQRLRFATVPAQKPLLAGVQPSDRWWWHVIPRNANPELLEELAGREAVLDDNSP
jgi:hypothetical protein